MGYGVGNKGILTVVNDLRKNRERCAETTITPGISSSHVMVCNLPLPRLFELISLDACETCAKVQTMARTKYIFQQLWKRTDIFFLGTLHWLLCHAGPLVKWLLVAALPLFLL